MTREKIIQYVKETIYTLLFGLWLVLTMLYLA